MPATATVFDWLANVFVAGVSVRLRRRSPRRRTCERRERQRAHDEDLPAGPPHAGHPLSPLMSRQSRRPEPGRDTALAVQRHGPCAGAVDDGRSPSAALRHLLAPRPSSAHGQAYSGDQACPVSGTSRESGRDFGCGDETPSVEGAASSSRSAAGRGPPALRVATGITAALLVAAFPAGAARAPDTPVPKTVQAFTAAHGRTLSLGVRGKDVRRLRRDLVRLGYLPPRAFGPNYDERVMLAVTAFQKWENLPRDGTFGKQRPPRDQASAHAAPRASPEPEGARRGAARPSAAADHPRRSRHPRGADLERRGRPHSRRHVQRLLQVAEQLVQALQGLAAVGELLQRGDRLPRLPGRSGDRGLARLRSRAAEVRARGLQPAAASARAST